MVPRAGVEQLRDLKARGGPLFRPGGYFGRALRTDRDRIVEWINTKTNRVAQIELYDHRTDPQENNNVAAEHPEVVRELSKRLAAIRPTLRNL